MTAPSARRPRESPPPPAWPPLSQPLQGSGAASCGWGRGYRRPRPGSAPPPLPACLPHTMAPLRAESAAGGRWIPATRAGGPSVLHLLLLLGAVLTPQDSVAQLLTTPGSLESEAIQKPQDSMAQLLTTPGSLESEVPTGEMVEEYYQRIELCWHNYTVYMDSVKGDWCDWTVISRPYSDLQNCLEQNADDFQLGFPNPMAEELIFQTHQIHFANCTLMQPTLSDPPEDVLLAMIIAPICLIPFLVTLVVWKSKDNETQA